VWFSFAVALNAASQRDLLLINDKQREILVIAQEEAAEVIQEISKVFRFGLHATHKEGMLHQVKLEEEVGDLLAMIQLMCEHGLINESELEHHRLNKISKLHKWSSIFKD